MKKTLRDCLLMSSLLMSPGLAQPIIAQVQTQEIVINMKNESLAKAFKRLEKATKYKVLYARGRRGVDREPKHQGFQRT